MPIRLMKTKAAFEGAVSVEEADALQAWLIAGPSRRIDLARCTHLHPASLQVLLSLRSTLETNGFTVESASDGQPRHWPVCWRV